MTIDQMIRANLKSNEVLPAMSRADCYVLGYQAAVEDAHCLTKVINFAIHDKYSDDPTIGELHDTDPLVLALKEWYGTR